MSEHLEESNDQVDSEYFTETHDFENIWIIEHLFENSNFSPDPPLNTKIVTCDDKMKLTHLQHQEEMHLSFWVKFYELEFHPAKSEITFLQFGKNPKSKSLTFSLNKEKQLVVKYFTQELKLGKITSNSTFSKGYSYFVCFSLYNTDKFTEIILTINCEMQTSVSFTHPIFNNFHTTIFGSEVFSSPFCGAISDVMIVYDEWPAQAQVITLRITRNCRKGNGRII